MRCLQRVLHDIERSSGESKLLRRRDNSAPPSVEKPTRVRAAILLLLPLFAGLVGSAPVAISQTVAPKIFFSDLESGPNTGGENNSGAFVTVYGNYFGSSPQVTVGGQPAILRTPPTSYLWYQKLVIQLGSKAVTGNIVVTTSAGASNGVPFTVRPGNIHFVATSGSDANSGGFTDPWATLQYAADTMAPGDITYARDGVTQAAQSYNGSLIINGSGAAGAPKALVAYPGAVVSVGAAGSGNCLAGDCYEGLYNGEDMPQPSYWVIAGMRMAGQDRAIKVNGDDSQTGGVPHDWRVVGNDFTCPWDGIAEDACVVFGSSGNIKYFGNSMHDVATLTPDSIRKAESMGVYFTTDTNHVEVGWNTFYNIAARGGIQFHSTWLGSPNTGLNLYDISIHDNLMHDGHSDGIILASISPEKGPVLVYNNVIYNWGTGPMPQDGGTYTCIYITGGANNGPDTNGTVPVQVYNNTLYNCATGTPPPDAPFIPAAIAMGTYSPLLRTNLQNNIVYSTGGIPYVVDYNQVWPADGVPTVAVTGQNNLFFGNTDPAPAAGFTSTISADPLFVNLAAHDFHLQPASPALSAGISIPQLTMDIEGDPRPAAQAGATIQALTTQAYALGAFQNVGATAPPGISVTVTPSAATLSPGQTKRFTATVTGATNTAVMWSMTPATGTLSTDGTYTAPSSLAAPQTVTIVARSAMDASKSASATVSLVLVAQTLQISAVQASSITSTSAVIKWTTNAGADSQVDYGATSAYGFSSLLDTNSITTHSVTISNLAPSTLYHFRVKSHDSTGTLVTSGDFTFTTLGSQGSQYTLSVASAVITSPASLTVAWTAAAGSGDADWIGLYPVGAPSNADTVLWSCYANYPSYCDGTTGQVNSNRTSGSLTSPALALDPGQYEFRYLLNDTYTVVKTSNTITVH